MVIEAISTASGGVVVLAAAALRRDPQRRWDDAVTLTGFFVYFAVGGIMLDFCTRLTASTCDSALLRIDRALGVDTIAFMLWTRAHGWAFAGMFAVYCLLSPLIGVVWVTEQNRTLRRALLLAGIFCFIPYLIFPAVGPAWTYWKGALAIVSAPPNCMPSMHFTWALLLCANAQRRSLRVITYTYAGLLALATVGLGEHYAVDLLAAVPYTFTSQYVAQRFPRLW